MFCISPILAVCNEGFFACSRDGPCLEEKFVCDNFIDCVETKADERDCKYYKGGVHKWSFVMNYGIMGLCFLFYWVFARFAICGESLIFAVIKKKPQTCGQADMHNLQGYWLWIEMIKPLLGSTSIAQNGKSVQWTSRVCLEICFFIYFLQWTMESCLCASLYKFAINFNCFGIFVACFLCNLIWNALWVMYFLLWLICLWQTLGPATLEWVNYFKNLNKRIPVLIEYAIFLLYKSRNVKMGCHFQPLVS